MTWWRSIYCVCVCVCVTDCCQTSPPLSSGKTKWNFNDPWGSLQQQKLTASKTEWKQKTYIQKLVSNGKYEIYTDRRKHSSPCCSLGVHHTCTQPLDENMVKDDQHNSLQTKACGFIYNRLNISKSSMFLPKFVLTNNLFQSSDSINIKSNPLPPCCLMPHHCLHHLWWTDWTIIFQVVAVSLFAHFCCGQGSGGSLPALGSSIRTVLDPAVSGRDINNWCAQFSLESDGGWSCNHTCVHPILLSGFLLVDTFCPVSFGFPILNS